MNSVQRLRARIKIALLIESFRGSSNIPELVQLASKYSIPAEDELIRSSIKEWEDSGMLIVARDLSGYVGASLKSSCVSDALEDVLHLLDADTFRVDWEKEKITTDAKHLDLIPGLEGWELVQLAKEPTPKVSATADANQPSNPAPIQITNNFSPVNTIDASTSNQKAEKVNWAGWVSVGVAVSAIVVGLWLEGRLW